MQGTWDKFIPICVFESGAMFLTIYTFLHIMLLHLRMLLPYIPVFYPRISIYLHLTTYIDYS